MHERAALCAWEHRLVYQFRDLLVICEDHASAGASERLMSRSGYYVCIWDRRRMESNRHKTGYVGHINHKIRANRFGYFGDTP